MAITHNLTLDVHKRTSRIPPEVVVRQGESGTETIVASITKDGEAYTSGLSSVRLDILHADGTWARVTGTKSGSTVTVTLPSAALSSHGLCKLAHLVFFDASNADVESTEGFLLRILQAVDGSGQGSQDYDDRLDALYKKWLAYEREAEASESARVSAEAGRVGAEASRAGAESARAGNETARVSAETGRATAEGTRQAKEAERQAAEAARAAAEGKRASVETSRASAEAARADAETARVAAEKRRETDQARNNADQAANNAAAQGLLVELVAEGGYDPSTLEPTADGKVGTLYLVPDPKASGDNAYAEWMWVNGKWERVGSSNATVAGLTTEQVDAVASGGTVTSENVVNGSVLTYLWAKLRAAFAPRAHEHSARDVTSGTLDPFLLPTVPVARGGTGATTAEGARAALGVDAAIAAAIASAAKTEVIPLASSVLNPTSGDRAVFIVKSGRVCTLVVNGLTNGSTGNLGMNTSLIVDESSTVLKSLLPNGYRHDGTLNIQVASNTDRVIITLENDQYSDKTLYVHDINGNYYNSISSGNRIAYTFTWVH